VTEESRRGGGKTHLPPTKLASSRRSVSGPELAWGEHVSDIEGEGKEREGAF